MSCGSAYPNCGLAAAAGAACPPSPEVQVVVMVRLPLSPLVVIAGELGGDQPVVCILLAVFATNLTADNL